MTNWSNGSKQADAFSNGAKTASTFDDGTDFLLKEDTYFLLLEDGSKIILDQSSGAKHNPTFTNPSKN